MRQGLLTMAKKNPYLNSRSFEYRFRKKRYEIIKAMIDRSLDRRGRCRIIDIGGAEYYWHIAENHIDDPRIQIDIVNLEKELTQKTNFRSFIGNACALGQFDDMSYDIAHSNSVIEHVGTWSNMSLMANHVRRLAPAYFVQTPYFWFPYEPHFRTPFFQWMPESWRLRLIMSRDLGFMKKAETVDEAMHQIQSVFLLDHSQYSTLFPEANIVFERFLGLPKSMLALRQDPA